MGEKREKKQQDETELTDSGVEYQPGSAVGAVQESPRSADETSANDPVASSGVAREERQSSSASGLTADDPDGDEARKKAYRDGATLVSRID